MNPAPNPPSPADASLSRRIFLQSTGAVAGLGAGVGAVTAAAAATPATAAPEPPAATGPTARGVTLKVNGQTHTLTLEPRVTLLDALRENLHMTGTKKGCDRGQCGACTVLVDGRRVNSCLSLAVMQEGTEITTIEGLGTPRALHPVQAAFLSHDAFQCGYCTPGQICSTIAMLHEVRAGMPSTVTADVRGALPGLPTLSDAEIRERLSGNICRCGAYANIVAAVRELATSQGGAA